MERQDSNGIKGLKHLHSLQIIHRTLHSTNILIDDGNLMITVFGLSKGLNEINFNSALEIFAYIDPQCYVLFSNNNYHCIMSNVQEPNQRPDIYEIYEVLYKLFQNFHDSSINNNDQNGYCNRNGIGTDKDETKAIEWYLKLAENGYAIAQYNLDQYANGIGTNEDEIRAFEWFLKNATAQYILGNLYGYGQGIIKDREKAIYWYQKAADNGNAIALYNLSIQILYHDFY
ncbi:hypothetical protein C1645_878914 [Glomus cerebriforme]|uniref:Protein kinase domain-containing protein n=1 Tax=Glomus cerebriforme TaxID=658196 RepID=A0A397SJ34_9GLOM|nr:hypothetical protein C1645_878914 [Glomus cerebriforme]